MLVFFLIKANFPIYRLMRYVGSNSNMYKIIIPASLKTGHQKESTLLSKNFFLCYAERLSNPDTEKE